MRNLIAVAIFLGAGFAQTITVTSPGNNSTISGASIPLTVSISSAPTTEHVDYYVGGKYYTTSHLSNLPCSGLVCSGPGFSSVFYPMAGDTTTTIQAIAKDVYGSTLATSAANTFAVLNNGAVLALTSLPSGAWTGDVTFGVSSNWSTHGPKCFIDGRPGAADTTDGYFVGGSGGTIWTVNSYHFPNGLHEIYCGMSDTHPAGSLNFAPSAVNTSTSVLTLNGATCANCSSPNHPFLTGQAVVLSTTGAAPGGLTAGNTYYIARLTSTTVQLATSTANATSCAASSTNCITITTQGTGTHTFSFNLVAALFWAQDGCPSSCLYNQSYSYSRIVADFENTNAPMELRTLQDVYLYQDATTTASLAPYVQNADNSTTAISASAPVYRVTGPSGVATVSSSGLVSAVAPGYTTLTATYSTLPVATINVTVKPVTNFPQLTNNGQVVNQYVPGTGPSSSTFMTAQFSSGGVGQVQPGMCPEWNWSGTTLEEDALYPSLVNTAIPDYLNGYSQWSNYWNAIKTDSTNCNHGVHILWEPIVQPNGLPYIYNNLGNWSPTRLAAVKQVVTDIATFGRTPAMQFKDEGNVYYGSDPHPSAVVGSSKFTGVVVSGTTMLISGSFGNFTAWDNSTSNGYWVTLTGATTAGLNGPYKVIAPITLNANPQFAGNVVSFTVPNTNSVPNGTYNASNNSGMAIIVGWSGLQIYNGQSCVVPGGSAGGSLNQAWSSNFTQIQATNNIATATWTSCCSGSATSDSLQTGDIIRLWNPSHAELSNVFPITRVDNNHFTFPLTIANTTYNASTDPALTVSRDCRETGNELTNIQNQIMAGIANAPSFGANTVGPSLADPAEAWYIPNWLNNPAFGTHASLYSNPSTPDYNGGLSLWEWTGAFSYATTARSLWGAPAIAGTISVQPVDYDKFSRDTHFTPGVDKSQGRIFYEPHYVPMQIWYALMLANVVGARPYVFETGSNLKDAYNTPAGTNYTQGFNPFTHWTGHWTAQSLAFTTIQKLLKYILQPPISSPYYGPFMPTAARQMAANAGRILIVLNTSEMPRPQLVDFTNYKYSGGLIRRYRVSATRAAVLSLSGSSASDTPTFEKGEAILYVFQPSGSTLETVTVPFGAPASFPAGTDSMSIRTNFYHAMNGDAVNCTTGCSIEMDLNATDMWYQKIYSLAGVPKMFGDPQIMKHR